MSHPDPPPRPATGRRALWGVAPVATSPEVWQGARRRRLVRATTITSVMGLAWSSTTTPVLPTRTATEADAAVADAATDGTAVAPMPTPFERYAAAAASARQQEREDRQDEARRRRRARRREERRAEQARAERQERRARRRAEAKAAAEAEAAANAWRSHPIASHEQVVLVQPAADVRLVGFHEAAMPGAVSLGLTSRPDAHHGRDWVPHTEQADELATMVLPSRARGTHSSTAIDVAIPAGTAVHAPVTGTVTRVEPYLLYGRHPDTRLVIRPDARPDLRLVVLHVTGHAVAVGDHVEAGVTPIAASPTPFPFESQIDRFTASVAGDATPHVHLELRPG